MEAIAVRNVSFAYPGQEENALKDLSFTVGKGAFFVVCGTSGCGKSTLLRQLKPILSPHGRSTGEILFFGEPIQTLDIRRQAAEIGFVGQSPDSQIVTDKVWHELAFGLESLGLDTPAIRRRVSEMASFFGIQEWFYRDTDSLSGGQKQLLNLASVMVMQPKILILDEPTAFLDPIAASEFLSVLRRVNRELGVTVILAEHRLEEAFSLADRTAVLEKGRLLCEGTPQETGEFLRGSGMFRAMPAAMRIWASVESTEKCPVTVGEGRLFLEKYAQSHPLLLPEKKGSGLPQGRQLLRAEELRFRYDQSGKEILKGLHLSLHSGELFALLGGNGTGKTTVLKILAGLKKPDSGALEIHGRVGMLPQDPQALFVQNTVWEELKAVSGEEEKMLEIASLCKLDGLLSRHPYDLSGGEQQRAALAKILLCEPDILLLDEPTKGMDAPFKQIFAKILQRLKASGKALLMVSHDMDFCAENADTCALLFDGIITAEGSPETFFSGSSFYTTAACRMAGDRIPGAVTTADVIAACGGRPEKEEVPEKILSKAESIPEAPAPLPLFRKLAAAVSGMAAAGILLYAAANTDLSESTAQPVPVYAALFVSLFILLLSVSRKTKAAPVPGRKLSASLLPAAVMLLAAVPLTLYAGLVLWDSRRYNLISLAVLIECMLPFFWVFEKRRPKARELVILASLCAIGVAGRAAFFMLPECKPVLALTILTGAALGSESGFLVGAVTMLVSNILFSQGPWTPWQMFAMGLCGFLAGLLFRSGRSTVLLCIYGAFSAVVIYGGIMNAFSALIWSTSECTLSVILAYCATGFPMDCVHALATVFFLMAAAQPMLQKLERVRRKYGLHGA